MENEIAVQIKNLTKTISKKTIVSDLTLDIYRGQILGLLGPNGAGKTTTIKMIVGLMSITSGQVIIEGNSITKDFEKAIKNVGAIVENPEFYKKFSGYKNLLHFARMYDDVPKERIDEVVKLVKLQDSINNKVKTYSLGMRQRLGIALALLHKPSIIILDEPTNGLDPEGIAEMRAYLKNIAKEENIAIMVSSHLLAEMELMCDRIAVIKKGKLIDVRDLNEKVEVTEGIPVRFFVDLNDEVKEKIKVLNLDNIKFEKESFLVKVAKKDVPEINRKLVESKINVYGIEKVKESLESTFMKIVEEGDK